MARRSLPDVKQRIVSEYVPKGIEQATAATKAFEYQSEASTNKVSAAARRLEREHQAAARNITRSYLDMTSAIDPHLASLTSVGQKATSALGDIQRTGGMMGSTLALAVAGGALVATGAVAEFTRKGVEEFTQLADSTRALHQTMGGTVEQASRLVEAGNAIGVTSDTTATGMNRLSQNIAAGSKHFEEYGIQVQHAGDGTVDLHATLLNIIDAFNATNDPVVKDRIAFEAFGKAGASMIPILARGRDALTELEAAAQNVMTADDLDRATRYELAQKRLEERNKSLAISWGNIVTPALTNFTAALSAGLGGASESEKKAVEATSAWDKFGETLKGGIPIIGGFLQFNDLGSTIDNAHAAETGLADATRDGAGATQAAIDAANERTTALEKEYTAQLGLVDAEMRAKDSTLAVARGTTAIAAAQEALNRARAGDPNGSGVQSAEKGVEAAQKALAAAQKAAASSTTQDQQNVAAASSQRAVQKATEDVAKAQDYLNKLKAMGAEGSPVYTQALEAEKAASDNLTQAQDAQRLQHEQAADADTSAAERVQNAQDNLKDAQDNLNKARQDALPKADAIRSAEENLQNAYRTQAGNISAAAHAFVDLKKMQADARGEDYNATQQLADYNSQLDQLTGKTTGPVHDALMGFISDYQAVLATVSARASYHEIDESSMNLSDIARHSGVIDRVTAAADRAFRKELSNELFGADQLGGARAMGGPTVPGSLYMVGEKGPELRMETSPGYIFPTGTGPGGATTVINIGQVKDDATIRQLERELAWSAKTRR